VNITILTYGSRGDVQPFLALAVGLQKRGHQVKLAAPHRFTGLSYSIPLAPLAGDQMFWGKRVHAIGAGPRPIPVRGLTATRLASALAEAEGDALRDRARLLGRAI
jgi:UDP:flavonoid glycosyltransferase YjiC (YdhE family)